MTFFVLHVIIDVVMSVATNVLQHVKSCQMARTKSTQVATTGVYSFGYLQLITTAMVYVIDCARVGQVSCFGLAKGNSVDVAGTCLLASTYMMSDLHLSQLRHLRRHRPSQRLIVQAPHRDFTPT